MPWSSTSGNQGVTFTNLKDAVDTNVFTARVPVPTGNELVTKADAINYVNIDSTINNFSVKESNQLVVKNDLVRLASTTCVANCTIAIRNLASTPRTLSFFSPGGSAGCRGNYNFTQPNQATNTTFTLTNNWQPGAMPITLTAPVTQPISIEYSLDGGSSYTTIQTATLTANAATLFETVSVPNVPGYILRVTMYDTSPSATYNVNLYGSKPSGGINYEVLVKGSYNASLTAFGSGPVATFFTNTCDIGTNWGSYQLVEYWHFYAKPVGSTTTALNPDSDVYEAYYLDGANVCGTSGTLTAHYKKLNTSSVTNVSVQPRMSGGAYVLAPTYNLNVYSTAPVGTIQFEYTLIREGVEWYRYYRPFLRPTTTTCTFLGTIKLRPGDQIKMRLLSNGGLVNHLAALDSVDCPSSGVASCETTITMTGNRDVAFRPTLGNFGLEYAMCL